VQARPEGRAEDAGRAGGERRRNEQDSSCSVL